MTISENTKAILLLTAPLIVGKSSSSNTDAKELSPGEYNKLASELKTHNFQPQDLTSSDSSILSKIECIEAERISALVARGFLLGQAIDHWQSRGIWVLSRADKDYPKLLKDKLKQYAPPILYGCGNLDLLDEEGVGIVGSRKVDKETEEWTREIASLIASSGLSVVSGGAKGVDITSMNTALESGGSAIGFLGDSLFKKSVDSGYRSHLMDGRLTLLSAVDPSAGFNVGNAMQRNKFIYAFSKAGIVVNADFEKGGTWSGAVEQLKRFKCCKVFVRIFGKVAKGNKELVKLGAMTWPNPHPVDKQELTSLVNLKITNQPVAKQEELCFPYNEPNIETETQAKKEPKLESIEPEKPTAITDGPSSSAAEELYNTVRTLLFDQLSTPKSDKELAELFLVRPPQIKDWLERMLKENTITKTKRPVKYVRSSKQEELNLL